MMRITTWTLPLALTLLAACGTPAESGPDSPDYAYSSGGRFVLNQPLVIPPDAATVRLQFGAVVARNAVQEVEPYCIFEVNTVATTAQAIQPDSFEIRAVRKGIDTFGMMALPRRVSLGDDDRPSHLYFKTEFRLHSPRQPDVRAMTCQSNQMAPGIAIMRHLRIDEIQSALGHVFSLRLGV
jgi:hypothetical protein